MANALAFGEIFSPDGIYRRNACAPTPGIPRFLALTPPLVYPSFMPRKASARHFSHRSEGAPSNNSRWHSRLPLSWAALALLAAVGCGKDNERAVPLSDGGPGLGDAGGAASGGGDTAPPSTGGQTPTGTGGASSTELPEWIHEEGPGRQVAYAGVNLAGAEFGSEIPGTFNQDYTYPSVESIAEFRDRGVNVVRLPFRWERLQQTLNEPFDTEELARLRTFVDGAGDAGVSVILDPHNYARYNDVIIGTDEVPTSAFVDFWERLADAFLDDDHVIFGLMNEPHDLGEVGTSGWLDIVNAVLVAIRDRNSEHLVLVPGDDWTGAHSWLNGNASVMAGVVDPADHFAFEVHQYLDSNSSGSGSECVSETVGAERLAAFTDWARAGGYQAVLGEFGAPPTATCLAAVDDMLAYMGENNDVWLGWTWWAAGPWWGDYALSIQPEGDETPPQLLVLERHLSPE